MTTKKYAITGAFGFSGKHIAQNLLDQGHEVITITGRPNRPNPWPWRPSKSPTGYQA